MVVLEDLALVKWVGFGPLTREALARGYGFEPRDCPGRRRGFSEIRARACVCRFFKALAVELGGVRGRPT